VLGSQCFFGKANDVASAAPVQGDTRSTVPVIVDAWQHFPTNLQRSDAGLQKNSLAR
jgi:hypothetical protein